MFISKLTLFFFILLFICKLHVAQNPYYKIINKQSGIASNTVYDVLYSKNGFIYIATDKGICKYDGASFKVLKNSKQKSPTVTTLIEVENGDIYCQNFNGDLFYVHNDTIYTERRVKTSGNFFKMHKLDKSLYIFNQTGFVIYNYLNKTISKQNNPNATYAVTCLDNKNLITQNYQHQLIKINYTKPNTILSNQINKQINFIRPFNKGYILFNKTNNQYLFYLYNGKLITIDGIKETVFINNVITINNELWICTTNGIYILQNNLKLKNDSKPLFMGQSISSICKDTENSYWISTLNNGLLYVPNLDVLYFKPNSYKLSCINYGKTTHELLVGTTTNQLLQFNLKTKCFETLADAGYENEVNSCLYNQQLQQEIFGSKDLIIVKNKRIIHQESFGVKNLQLYQNSLLIGFSYGICLFNKPKVGYKIPKHIKDIECWEKVNRYNLIKGQDGYRCRDMVCNEKDSLCFLAFSNGLFYRSNNTHYEIKYNNESLQAISLALSNHNLYIVTYQFGVLKYDISSQQFEALLPNINASKIKIHSSHLFLLTENGLLVYNIKNKTTDVWNISKGLNAQAELKDLIIQNDTCYIASSEGVILVPYKSYSKNKHVPQLAINSILHNNQKVNNTLNTKYGINNIIISYTVLCYKLQDSAKIYYKLNNDSWQKLQTTSGEIRLSNLSPNKYFVSFKIINEDGVENNLNNQISITIKPLFYQTWWFVGLLIILGILVGLWINKMRLQQQLKKQAETSEKILLKHQLELSQLKTLRSQMNPHFIFNALNTLQSHIYSGNSAEAKAVLNLFSDLSRAMLSNSQQLEISIKEELQLITLYLQLEQKRLPKILYKININETIDVFNTLIPAMLVQPIVENAVKHGISNKPHGGLVTINITNTKEYILFEIDDDGIGRVSSELIKNKQNVKHQSFATYATENRIELLNKNNSKKIKLEIIDKLNKEQQSLGTLVKLYIPQNND